MQQLGGSTSAWDPEDLSSNKLGAIFGSEIAGNRHNLVISKFKQFIIEQNILDPNDPKIAEDKIYIPGNEQMERLFPLPQKTNYNPYFGEKSNYIQDYILYGPPKFIP